MSDPYADDAPEGRFQLGFLRQLWPFVRPYRRGFLAGLVGEGAWVCAVLALAP